MTKRLHSIWSSSTPDTDSSLAESVLASFGSQIFFTLIWSGRAREAPLFQGKTWPGSF